MIYKGLHSVTHDKTSTTFNCINVFEGDGENIDASFSITHSDHSVSPESIMRNIPISVFLMLEILDFSLTTLQKNMDLLVRKIGLVLSMEEAWGIAREKYC